MKTLPSHYTIPDFIPQATNQGSRGTCTAFSTTSLLEYYLDYKQTLSQQYLYACCKLADNTNKPGAALQNVRACVKQFGVLPREQWPYNQYNTGQEAQITVDRIREFQSIPLTDIKFHQLYTTSNIDEYKYILTGYNGHAAMPIVIDCQLYSDMNIQNDWLDMPAPWASPSGRHAMLIYGYHNADHIPGGGYFLVQNSWGKDLTNNNTGLLKIPYEYIAKNVYEAFTILKQTNDADKKENTAMQKFTSIAREPMKDALSQVYEISEGDSIIVDDAGNARLNTPQNYNDFVRNGNSFWPTMSKELQEQLSINTQHARQFGAALDIKIKDNLGTVIPDINLPGWVYFVPDMFNLKFKKYRELSFNNDEFYNCLSDCGAIPRLETLRTNDANAIKSANFFRAYELSNGSIVFRFMAFFITPVNFSNNLGEQQVLPANSTVYENIMTYFKKWERSNGLRKPNCNCFILAAQRGWDNVTPFSLHDNVQILCHLDENNIWEVRHQSLNNYRRVYREFIYSLYPESFDNLCQRVEDFIQANKWSFSGNITTKKLSKNLNRPEDMIERCCDQLQKTNRYINYWAGTGTEKEKAIKLRTPEDKSTKLVRFFKTESVIAKHLKFILLAVIAAIGVQLRTWLLPTETQAKLGAIPSFIGLFVICYLAGCVKGYLNRKLNK